MNCIECRGACCLDFSIPIHDLRPPNEDARSWIALHASREGVLGEGVYLRFECRCLALTPDGRCAIYDSRPNVCREFLPGGADCLDSVRRRRTPEQYQAIREDGDPETIHP